MDESKKSGIERKTLDAARLLRIAVRLALYSGAGYACGIAELPFGSSPFGVALLAAADKNAPFVYVGLVASCFFSRGQTDGAVYLGVYTALILLRALVRLTVASDGREGRRSIREIGEMLFGEHCAYRIMLSAVAALGLGACIFFGGGMLYYDLFGLLISTAAAPIATALLSRGFSGRGVMRDIGQLTLFALCIYGASELSVYGVSLSLFAALMLTFFVTEREGIGKGSVCGLMLGLVYSPILAPSCVFAALCLGIFMKLSPTLGLTTAFLSATAWAFYIKGLYALDGIFGAILASVLLYSAGRRLFASDSAIRANKREAATRRCRVVSEGELDGVRLCEVNRRMSSIGEGLARLASFFEELKIRYPQERDMRRICLEAFEFSCVGCPQENECPQRQNLESEAARLSFLLRRNRSLDTEDISADTVGRCSRLPDILDEINYNAGLRGGRYGASGDVAAPDYKALSRLLERGLEESGGEYLTDRELSEPLCGALDRLSLDIDGVAVFGKRRRTVYVRGASLRVLNEGREAILDALAAALPFRLDRKGAAVCRCSDGGGALTVSEAAVINVDSVMRQRIAREEVDFCGDSMAVFENDDGFSFSLISDGMGSGREAAAVSDICARFFENMLSVGRMNGELLSMLGGFLSGRCEGSLCECSATVDLMEVDLISGEAVFFKSGAAPTYIYRDGELFKLRSGTMPIGILPDSECRRCELTLSVGDVVVMISDGVTDGEEECPWLFDLLRQNIEQAGAERTADLIVKYAVAHGSRDDISVIVSRVVRA